MPSSSRQNRAEIDNDSVNVAILLRICLTPMAFALVSKAQSRFGDWIGGRLIGLPLTTGPFLLTVCMTTSRTTAAHAAAGVTSGQMAVVVFCCSGYAWSARRESARSRRPITSLGVALMAVFALRPDGRNLVSRDRRVGRYGGTSLALWPWARHEPAAATADPDADVPSTPAPMLQRALISTCVVATMSTLVPILGARPAGVITSAPVLLSIILPSTHRQSGAGGAAAVARGTILSMAATVAFSAVLASTLPHMSVGAALLLSAGVLCALIAATPLLGSYRAGQSCAAGPSPCSSAPLSGLHPARSSGRARAPRASRSGRPASRSLHDSRAHSAGSANRCGLVERFVKRDEALAEQLLPERRGGRASGPLR